MTSVPTSTPLSSVISAPFPPGIGPVAAAVEMKAAAIDAMEQQLSLIAPHAHQENQEELVEAVRKVVLTEVDKRVQEKVDELWQRGRQMISSIQTKHNAKTEAFEATVAKCQQQQLNLEADNEKLRQVLTSLTHGFTMFGAAVGQKDVYGMVPNSPEMDASTVTTSNCSNLGTPSELFSPGMFTPATEANSFETEYQTQPPGLPEFPFVQPLPATPLSVAEALPPQSPVAAPQSVSLASALTPPPVPGAPVIREDCSTFTFSFTLRKAAGTDLGLSVTHKEGDQELTVERVRPGGAVDAWNKQCSGCEFDQKVVLPNDTIVSVNGVMYDPVKMLEECRDKKLLKFSVARKIKAAA